MSHGWGTRSSCTAAAAPRRELGDTGRDGAPATSAAQSEDAASASASSASACCTEGEVCRCGEAVATEVSTPRRPRLCFAPGYVYCRNAHSVTLASSSRATLTYMCLTSQTRGVFVHSGGSLSAVFDAPGRPRRQSRPRHRIIESLPSCCAARGDGSGKRTGRSSAMVAPRAGDFTIRRYWSRCPGLMLRQGSVCVLVSQRLRPKYRLWRWICPRSQSPGSFS